MQYDEQQSVSSDVQGGPKKRTFLRYHIFAAITE